VVPAIVHKFQGEHRHVEGLGEQEMGSDVAALQVACQQGVPRKERVSFTFKGDVVRQTVDVVALRSKPLRKERLFDLPLGRTEPRDHATPSSNQPCIGGKHHIRSVCSLWDQIDLRAYLLGKHTIELLPLGSRQHGIRQLTQRHPGIDLVFQPISGGWAHKESRWHNYLYMARCWRWNEFLR